MISLRKFLTADQASDHGGLMRVVQLLIQGIALHAVEGDPQDYLVFRRDIQKLLDAVEHSPSPTELLVNTGSVLKALEDYNSRTTRHLRMQGAELYHMIAMLTRTVETLGSGGEQSFGRLREIEGLIEKTVLIEDVRVLKLRLGECLEGIRTEAKRQKSESLRTVETLQQEIKGSQERISAAGAGPVLDPTTGLPARAAAAASLAEWALTPKPPFAGLFVVDRVALINTRFGYAIGDRVLNAYLEDLRNRLPPSDQIFRWSGPAFLALLHRTERIEKVREQLRFQLPQKIERNFAFSNRSALLSISATWAVFPVAAPSEGLIEQLDSFLASHSGTPQT